MMMTEQDDDSEIDLPLLVVAPILEIDTLGNDLGIGVQQKVLQSGQRIPKTETSPIRIVRSRNLLMLTIGLSLLLLLH